MQSPTRAGPDRARKGRAVGGCAPLAREVAATRLGSQHRRCLGSRVLCTLGSRPAGLEGGETGKSPLRGWEVSTDGAWEVTLQGWKLGKKRGSR